MLHGEQGALEASADKDRQHFPTGYSACAESSQSLF